MKPVDRLTDDEFLSLVQLASALPDAPAELIRLAIGLWPAHRATSLKEAAQAALRLVTAVLTFDSWARPSVALGMRAGSSDTRHLLFSAMGRDIDLRISPAADQFALTGQILGPDDAGVIELATHADDGPEVPDARTAVLDAFGEFRLEGVQTGTYRVTLRMGHDTIVLPPIVVGQRSG